MATQPVADALSDGQIVQQFDDLCTDLSGVLHGALERLTAPEAQPVRDWLQRELDRVQEKASHLGKASYKPTLTSQELVVSLLKSQFGG